MSGVDAAAPERSLELADEAFAAGDVEGFITHMSAAIRGFTAADDKCAAAMACVRLGQVFAQMLGNTVAGRAWFARARRLIADEPPCIEQGWVAVAAMGCDVDDPDELLAAADLALTRARQFGDVDLETKALADGGLAHVQAGRLDAGMAMLDEAMALACGPAKGAETTPPSVCSFFTACYFAADFERAGSWADLLRQAGLIALEPGGPVALSSHCDSVQATLLMELGRWSDAEALLTRARADWAALMPMPGWHPNIALADLRIRQGRLADAEELLLGLDQWMQALVPAAHLQLARRDFDLARAIATRGLRALGDDRLRSVELLTVLIDTELACGDTAAATAACKTLTERVTGVDVPALQARAAAALARTLAATGDLDGAVVALEGAVGAAPLPLQRATLLDDLADLRRRTGDTVGAELDTKSAAALWATLDVGRTAPVVARTASLTPSGKWWNVSADGSSVRLPDTKGMRYLAELVARPGAERHALDLVDRVEGPAPERGDGQARAACRQRIEHLRAAVDDALATGMLETAEGAQAELDLFVVELGQSFGVGGTDQHAASAAERARLNVTRALRAAISKLVEAAPDAGAVLDRRVRTGLYCAYEPVEADGVHWIVQP